MPCKHCGDAIETAKCDICGKEHPGECQECHAEIAHGKIGPPMESRCGLAEAGWIQNRQYHGDNSRDNR